MKKKPSYGLSEQELELISRYLHGELDTEERKAFEERLAADGELRQKVEEVEALAIGVREVNLADRLHEWHGEAADTGGGKAQVRPLYRRWWVVAVAAAVLLVTAGVWFLEWGQPMEKKLFARYYKPDPGLPTLMGVSDNYTFENAMVDYKTGDYQKAIAVWQQLLKENPASDTLNYFIGSAYLAEAEADSAAAYFDKVVAVPGSAFLSDAHWYKALTLLREGKKEEAIAELQRSGHHAKDALHIELQRK